VFCSDQYPSAVLLSESGGAGFARAQAAKRLASVVDGADRQRFVAHKAPAFGRDDVRLVVRITRIGTPNGRPWASRHPSSCSRGPWTMRNSGARTKRLSLAFRIWRRLWAAATGFRSPSVTRPCSRLSPACPNRADAVAIWRPEALILLSSMRSECRQA
jgi:hypothetical protein